MTVVESKTEAKTREAKTPEAELLFQEAKQRRKHRQLVSGIVSLILIVVLGLGLGFGFAWGSGKPTGSAALPVIPIANHATANLSFRPVLCYAPPLTVPAGQTSAGPLPSCSSSYQLTEANLGVQPDSVPLEGYQANTVPPDPQFATYPSTTRANNKLGTTVLLPGTPTNGGGRYVLGPAAVTGNAVKSAKAQLLGGQWTISLDLTGTGSAQWDSFAQSMFHEIIGVVLNGKVISAPITQPTHPSFTSFDGHVQISGNFTGQQAKALAAEL